MGNSRTIAESRLIFCFRGTLNCLTRSEGRADKRFRIQNLIKIPAAFFAPPHWPNERVAAF